ncbi:FAD/NAD(P)-binding domain-containing protein [Nadsonia fulvescens var. elongata DSM 6958]|uniref:FAD/NAD(P)-binding domain-containing protein n=1 Tax=Nadsonia fulvescens var. elongata DSM 6958 TaxID=857566 RepID=A0A1E3PD25_9ASCO|nr:FAD/NAD(P)-binding domain-containing protein [Nadsonia fulvescens var. elongata DSM 6958]
MTIQSLVDLPVVYEPIDADTDAATIFGTSKSNVHALPAYNLAGAVDAYLARLNETLFSASSPAGINAAQFRSLFVSTGAWKDHLALQWDFCTFSADRFADELLPLLGDAQLGNFEVYVHKDTSHVPIHVVALHPGSVEWVQVFVQFTTRVGAGKGVLRLAPVQDADAAAAGQLKALAIYTALDSIHGHEESMDRLRPEGVNHGQHVDRESWKDRRQRETARPEPAVVIVGAGQGGLNVAARLKTMGVSSLIIDKNETVGDNWRNRYKFLVLHDPVWYDHLPYIPFPATWPIFTPKDKLGDWFEAYAKAMELNVWMKTTVDSATYDHVSGVWAVTVQRQNPTDGSVTRTTFNPRHVVMATGHSGEPNMPQFKGLEKFKGKVVHSSQHTTGRDFKGKNAIVVGCCNSAHDIAQDFYEQGASVTMVQRSSTCVISSEKAMPYLNKGLFDSDGPPTDSADLILHSMPLFLANAVQIQQTRYLRQLDSDILDGLTKVGFKLDYGYGSTGLFGKYFRRGGGYYIDVGCSKLIIDGKIKVKQGVEIKEFHESSVEFTDGSIIENLHTAVLATGYSNMKDTAKRIFGTEISDKLNPIWGLGEKDGDLQTIWRNSGHDGFWYMGGNLALARYFSKRLVLQIVAEENGLKERGGTRLVTPSQKV